jgi:hypothetical protein
MSRAHWGSPDEKAEDEDILHFAIKQHMQDRWRMLAQSLAISDQEFGEYFKAPIELITVQLIGLALDMLKLPRADAHDYVDHMKDRQEANFMATGADEFRRVIVKLVGEEHARVAWKIADR